jgi:hypothetical protein
VPGLRDDTSTELETLFREYYELVYRTEYITGTRQEAEDVCDDISAERCSRRPRSWLP